MKEWCVRMSNNLKEHIKLNYKAFEQQLPKLLPAYADKFALIRNEKIVEIFDTAHDAYIAAKKLYSDDLFSIQQITATPADLGFFSHAVPE